MEIDPNRINININELSKLSEDTKNVDLGKYDVKHDEKGFYLEKTWLLKRIFRWLNLAKDKEHYKELSNLIAQARSEDQITEKSLSVFDKLRSNRLKSRWSSNTQQQVNLYYQSVRILNECTGKDKLDLYHSEKSRLGIAGLLSLRDGKEKTTFQELVGKFEKACNQISPSLHADKNISKLVEAVRNKLATKLFFIIIQPGQVDQLPTTWEKGQADIWKKGQDGITTLLRIAVNREKQSPSELLDQWDQAYNKLEEAKIDQCDSVQELLVRVRNKINA